MLRKSVRVILYVCGASIACSSVVRSDFVLQQQKECFTGVAVIGGAVGLCRYSSATQDCVVNDCVDEVPVSWLDGWCDTNANKCCLFTEDAELLIPVYEEGCENFLDGNGEPIGSCGCGVRNTGETEETIGDDCIDGTSREECQADDS